MRTIARFMDARNTAEGKFLSVLLSVLLVFSFLNVTMFTDYANATDENAPEATVEENQSLDAVDPAADEPEEEAEEGEGAPEQEQPESEEPAGEVNEPEEKEADVSNVNKGTDESGANSKRIVARSQNLAAEPNAAVVLSADLELMIGDTERLEYSSNTKFKNYRWKVISGGNVVKITNDKGERSKTGNQYTYSNSVTAIAAGTATVEFQTSGDYGVWWTTRQTWTIEVTAPMLTGITIEGSDTVAEFASVNLTAILSPNGAVGQVVWASDDPSVATVDGRGRVTGVAAGKVTIRASVTNPDGASVTAEYEVTVTKSRSTHSAEFYYLKSPDSDPASNGTNNWGKTIGNGSIDVTNAEWNGINCFVSSQQNRIVEWPSGFDNGVVPRTSPHWNVIFDAFKSTVGSDVAEDDIESITLVPYKISKNDAYHVDCQVVVKAKQAATATFYLWDVEDTGYI